MFEHMAVAEVKNITEPVYRGDVSPDAFDHRAHIRLAYDLLCVCEFDVALHEFCSCVRYLAGKAGADDKFNMTVTVAFLSLIAEKMSDFTALKPGSGDFDTFMQTFPELMDRNVLSIWYTYDDLASDTARKIFLLPKINRPLNN